MTLPVPPGEPDHDDEDELAQLLLADATSQPDTGAPESTPAMGDDVTYPQQPTAPAPTPPAPPAPTPPPAPAPAPPAPPPVPAPPAVPQPQTQPPAPPAPAGGPSQPSQPGTGDPGFPANTPWRDMQPAEQLAYWQHQARRHEQRVKEMGDYDQLKATAEQHQQMVAAQQTEHERAVADARRQGREQALTEAGSQLVEQWVRAAALGRLPEESVNALLLGLDRKAFMNAQHGVDTDKVYQFVSSLIPAQPATPAAPPTPGAGNPGQPPQLAPPPTSQTVPQFAAPPGGPDFGQGQPGAPRPAGLAAGREIARQRFGTPSTPAPAQ